MKQKKICLFESCGRDATGGLGYCPGHYHQFYKGQELHALKSDRERGYHGTPGGYSNHSCRCELCVIAWNSYCQGRKSVKHGKAVKGEKADIGNTEHGTITGYHRGCKCAECLSANAEYSRERILNTAFRDSDAGKKMMNKCDGLCMCCKKNKATIVDHVHGTKLIRGYLCHACNTAIGKLGDTLEGLAMATRYLQENPGLEYDLPKVSPSAWK